LDRLYIHGNASGNIQRGVQMNGTSIALIDSYVSEIHAVGFEAQAIGGWAGVGPYKIVNNYLAGSGENILFGGGDPQISGASSNDIEIRHNYITKPLSWQGVWTVKNILELKNAKRVLIEGNVLENCWVSAQVAFGIVFQPITDNPLITWTTIQDVTVRYNWMRVSGSGINLIGSTSGGVVPMARISFTDNLVTETGQAGLGAEGKLVQIIGGWHPTIPFTDLTFSHNTVLHSQSPGAAAAGAWIIDGHGPKMQRVTILNNVVTSGGYTLAGNAAGVGTVGLNAYMDPWDFRGNVAAGEQYGSQYPIGNFWPASYASLGFDSQLRLGASLGLLGRGTDGKDPGADITALLAAISGVVP
jgi:hypothetical protein